MIEATKRQAKAAATHVARLIRATGATPNQLSLIGLLLNLIVAGVIAVGQVSLGGVLLLLAGGFDMLDGALARLTGQTSAFGAFLDSTLDRYSEAAVLFGILIEASRRGDSLTVALAFIVAIGSLLVSYTRARAEGLGLQCAVGWLQRPERVVLLSLGLIVGQPQIVLAILAFFTHLTALQRLIHVQRLLSQPPPPQSDSPAR